MTIPLIDLPLHVASYLAYSLLVTLLKGWGAPHRMRLDFIVKVRQGGDVWSEVRFFVIVEFRVVDEITKEPLLDE